MREPMRNKYKEAAALKPKQLTLLFQVELGLYLLEHLALRDEPISVLWAVLSGIPFPRLATLDEKLQKEIAVARILLPFASRFGWEQALRDYVSLPKSLKIYEISKDVRFDEQLVNNIRIEGAEQARLNHYKKTLAEPLPPGKDRRSLASPGKAKFQLYMRQHRTEVKIEIPRVAESNAASSDKVSERAALNITFELLEETAEALDARLKRDGRQAEWVERYQKYIHYYGLHDGVLAEVNSEPIALNGFSHIVGMVGAGKSTLMKLIAASIALFYPDKTITLVVGDVMTVLDIVEELNCLLAEDAQPVAIPLIGRSTRDTHLDKFYGRAGNESSLWAGHWLNPACPLMGLLSPEQIAVLPAAPLPGREPCEQIEPPDEQVGKRGKVSLCPFFHQCPSQQVWRDSMHARILVTTPGALAKSSVPTQVDRRRLKYGEYVYLRSDVVVFDEVDTVQEWFDNEYANVLDLWGKSSAVFNRADPATAQALSAGLSPAEERWVRAERHTSEALTNTLRQLSSSGNANIVRNWLGGRYFTAHNLFARLALNALGLPEYPSDDAIAATTDQEFQQLTNYFEEIMEGDPLLMARPLREQDDRAYRLSQIMMRMMASGAESVLDECVEWLDNAIPDLGENLDKLNVKRIKEHDSLETPETLGIKLALALSVALLDRNLRIVFYEWYNQPETVQDEVGMQIGKPTSTALSDVLPIPPLGRVFGTYYVQTALSDTGDPSGVLSRFEYVNIGRWFLLNFHKLLDKLGIPGPHVLTLSGTSWLPDSTRWHIDVQPQGILKPTDSESKQITLNSSFAFRPQYDETRQAIRISGADDKPDAVKTLARAMLSSKELENELDDLERLAAQQPDLWADRARILLLTNSYAQARAFAEELGKKWKQLGQIFYLSQTESNTEELMPVGKLPRGDTEQFALTTGKVLIAPLSAIGRGYNILTVDRQRAAFGTVYFLVRPMPHPYDIQALAGELNAYTLNQCSNPDFEAWVHPRLHEQAKEFRRHTKEYWARAEMRRFYRDLNQQARRDLAATTFGRIVQATGRLVRGGVPFRAYFVDASWAPNSANAVGHTPNAALDSGKDSLLAEMVLCFEEYTDGHPIGQSLYQPFSALLETKGFYLKRTI